MISLRSFFAYASAFVLGAVFILSTGSTFAGTNPPFVNPPSGSVNPSFMSIESAKDITVGENLKVGNSIQPKGGGTTLLLDAANVAIKNNFEAKGSAVVKDLTAKNGITSSAFNLATFNPDGSISKTFNGLLAEAPVGKPELLTLKSAGAVRIQNMTVLPEKDDPNTATISGPTNLSLDFFNVNAVKDVNVKGTLKAGNITSNTASIKESIIDKLTVSEDFMANKSFTLFKNGLVNGDFDINGSSIIGKDLKVLGSLDVGKDFTSGGKKFLLDTPNVSLKGDLSSKNITATEMIDAKNLSVSGAAYFQNKVTLNASIKPGEPILNVLGNTTVKGTIKSEGAIQSGDMFYAPTVFGADLGLFPKSLVAGHVQANSIGEWKLEEGVKSYDYGLFAKKNSYPFDVKCSSGYIPVSCQGGFKGAAPEDAKGQRFYANGPYVTKNGCEMTVFRKNNASFDGNIMFIIQALCFNPSKEK